MIVGVGIDVCDIARFETSLTRSPTLAARLFTERELAGAKTRTLAGRFAAKEALAKALGSPGTLSWHDAEILAKPSGAPYVEVRGSVAALAADMGVGRWFCSISHDGGIATAIVIAEGNG